MSIYADCFLPIMATVTVKMNVCEKTHKITVLQRDDGDLDVLIESDCPKVAAFGERLNKLSLTDITDFGSSKINDPKIRGNISPTCLSSTGVFNAAWIEMEMMSRSLIKKVRHNSIDFVGDDGEVL